MRVIKKRNSCQAVHILYDIPSDAERGGHAHKSLEQIIVALSGSFDVVLNDGQSESIVTLNQPTIGLRLPQDFGEN